MLRCLQREAEAETCSLISDKVDGLRGGTWFLLRKVTRFQSKCFGSLLGSGRLNYKDLLFLGVAKQLDWWYFQMRYYRSLFEKEKKWNLNKSTWCFLSLRQKVIGSLLNKCRVQWCCSTEVVFIVMFLDGIEVFDFLLLNFRSRSLITSWHFANIFPIHQVGKLVWTTKTKTSSQFSFRLADFNNDLAILGFCLSLCNRQNTVLSSFSITQNTWQVTFFSWPK